MINLDPSIDIRNCYCVNGTLFPKNRIGFQAAIELAHELRASVYYIKGRHKEIVLWQKD